MRRTSAPPLQHYVPLGDTEGTTNASRSTPNAQLCEPDDGADCVHRASERQPGSCSFLSRNISR
ncbi:hypothetical protein OG21DRAFT_1505708 [Imleria badia]|nr:hypothetical protein OG21DRAFT_1505708 [Imleria badia]